MAIYEYRCEVDGPFDVTLPIGTAPSSIACPACAGEAGRVYTNPMVSFAPRPLVAALEHEEKTRYSAGHRHQAAGDRAQEAAADGAADTAADEAA